VPYARYGESPESVLAALEAMKPLVAAGLTREALQGEMAPGAARNALDCAFWDFEAKRTGISVRVRAGLPALVPLTTAYTISLDAPENMAAAAMAAAHRPLLKIKLGGDGDPARITAIRNAVPAAQLIVDANEGWNPDNLAENLAACARAGVTLVEQPLPAGSDAGLATLARPVAVCADESVHDRKSLAPLKGKYDAVNIKLDKAGGLTEALAMADEAQKFGFQIMAGCMVATSLAMAPAVLLAQRAKYVDLDGPLLLARDRERCLIYDGSILHPPLPDLWG
jgi:L-alanine-DL-glutamate epimerase-like enolase superfamily enzyme